MEFTQYFVWSGLFLLVFYMFYFTLLRRETFFVCNRMYLLISLLLAVLIPFLDIPNFVDLSPIELVAVAFSVVGDYRMSKGTGENLNVLVLVYWVGTALSAVFLLIKLYGVKQKLKLPADGAAFSFWRTKVIDPDLTFPNSIAAHEDVHVRQLHSLDILLMEVVQVFFWFNPLIYCYRQSLKAVHEYLADEYAVKFAGGRKKYAILLFSQNFKTGPALSNSFYNTTLLEARIRMLQQRKSNSYRLWKYAGSAPLLLAMLSIFAMNSSVFKNSKIAEQTFKAAEFPGGFDRFSKYLTTTAKKVSSKNGKVLVSFVVEADGSISHEKVENSVDAACDQEALRVIKLSPKWIAAVQNGLKVRSTYRIGINFITDNQQTKMLK